MKLRGFIFLWLCLALHASGQDLVRFEHFFDTDPGYGLGDITTITPTTTVTDFAIPISTSSLSPGFHTLHLRAENAINQWTHTHVRNFYLVPATTSTINIDQMEYFVDTDPGIGLATQVTGLTPAALLTNIPIDISTTALSPGFHRLYVRSKTTEGQWTHTHPRSFYIINLSAGENIVKFEYFFDIDPGFDNGTAAPIAPPSPTVTDQDIFADVSALSIGAHTIYVRAKDSGGEWTQVMTGSFSVTAALPPTITSFTPSFGSVGTTVTIIGTNFSTIPANNAVAFNGTSSIVTTSTSTSIIADVPVGATTGPITVTVAGNTAISASNFTVTVCPSAPTVIPSQGCQNTSVSLGASGGTNGQYRWYTVASGGTAIAGEVNSIYTTPILATTTTYYVSINDGACESIRTTVIATIITLPTPALATSTSICSGIAATLTASGGTNGQYKWYTVPIGGTAIAGEVNNSYTTPSLTATTTYYVTLTISGCESLRTSATVSIVNPPAPTTTSASACPENAVTLTAAGGSNGQYKWYTVATGGTSIIGEVNSTYRIPSLTLTAVFYVCVTVSGCESSRTPVTAAILTAGCAPVITPQPLTTQVEGKIVIDLVPLITTVGTLDVNSIKIVTPPSSGAGATITNGVLTIDYAGRLFSGTESILLEACNTNGTCGQQDFSIEVAGDIVVYNGVSPNGDGRNDFLFLQYIEVLSSTVSNQVTIYNRWGDEVASVSDYDNKTRVFAGLTANGSKLPAGTYFYKIILPDAGKTVTGFISLKH